MLENHGPDPATIDVLPTLWFRNTWSWAHDVRRPRIEREGHSLVVVEHEALAGYGLDAAAAPDRSVPSMLFCENETNLPRVFGAAPTTPGWTALVVDLILDPPAAQADGGPGRTNSAASHHH